jgi:hypothetical protein
VTSNLTKFGTDGIRNIISGLRNITETPGLSSYANSSGDFLSSLPSNIGNTASNISTSSYKTLFTISYDSVRGKVESSASNA